VSGRSSPPPLPPSRALLRNHRAERLHQHEPADTRQLDILTTQAHGKRFWLGGGLLSPAIPAPHTPSVIMLASDFGALVAVDDENVARRAALGAARLHIAEER
jgi:hypothetical protein